MKVDTRLFQIYPRVSRPCAPWSLRRGGGFVQMAAPQEGQGIQVLVRVRPPNEREKQSNRFCVEVDESQRAVLLSR
jgi:hypothetical protein